MEVAARFLAARGGVRPREVTLDVERADAPLFGDAKTIAPRSCGRTAADRGLRVRVAIAGTRTAARLLGASLRARRSPG
jgi:hypothetical protein